MSKKDEESSEKCLPLSKEQYSIEDDIINLSGFSFDDVHTWLCEPLRSSTEPEVYELEIRNIPTLEFDIIDDQKKSVDTRTFTRPKKRVRSILESANYLMPSLVSSIAETYPSEITDPYDESPHSVPYESIPPALRTHSEKCDFNYKYELSEPACTETLTNGMDYSLGIPELEHCDTLMNISQPSLMNWSMTSITEPTDESKLDTTYRHIVIDYAKITETLDATFNVNCGDLINEVPKANNYNTYKKNMFSVENREKVVDDIHENSNDHKYLTFTKKEVNEIEQHNNLEKLNINRDLNSTFCKKPETKEKEKFSKLPLSFQKSNPNLLSYASRKSYLNSPPRQNNAFGSKKQLNPNSTSTKMSLFNDTYQLGRAKSTSDQKLSELCRNTLLLQTTITKGSTESIESTQSGHSAPDLDDRLSARSDSSHSLYNVPTTNNLVSDSSPGIKSTKKVLDNTWISDELPSPILKSREEHPSSQSHNETITSSSPISSNESSRSPETCVSEEKIHNATYKTSIITKPNKVEKKSGLKPRVDWNNTGRIPNAASGIPRPASRIPAPRFLKPK